MSKSEWEAELRIVHLSDLHFRTGWHEEIGVVINALKRDLEPLINEETHFIFSGDIVQAGSANEYYDACTNDLFDFVLSKNKVNEKRLIFIPGNHDVDRDYVAQNEMNCKGLFSTVFEETGFNDYCQSSQSAWIRGKFENYVNFQNTVKCRGLEKNIFGEGFDIDDEKSVYLLNTAVCSNAGHKFSGSPRDCQEFRVRACG